MEEVIKNIPAIIAEAAKSPLAMIALIIIIISGSGLFFFKKDSVRIRLAIFCAIAAGLVTFAALLWGAEMKRQKENLQTTMNLTVLKEGNGEGKVTSTPPGIDCNPICAASYSRGTAVTLFQTTDDSSNFTGWSGGAGCTNGVVTLNESITCKAIFTARFCFVVDANRPWQSISLPGEFKRVTHISGQWSIDPEKYAHVDHMGYILVDASKVNKQLDRFYKEESEYPFGALLMRRDSSGSRAVLWITGAMKLEEPITTISMQINEKSYLLNDNDGSLTVCFGK